jgi:hypothetical protein
MTNTPDTERAWAAGFFDGEGHICARYTKHVRADGVHHYRRIEVQITQIHPDVLFRFKEAVGVGQVHGPYAAKGRRNPAYKFGVGGLPAVTQIVEAIFPYLSPVKRKQVGDVLRWYEESPATFIGSDKPRPTRTPQPPQ